jgi:hypothetical protein
MLGMRRPAAETGFRGDVSVMNAQEDRARVADPAAERSERFGELPRRVRPEDLVEETPVPLNDSQFDGDPEAEWMVRYSA